MPSQSLNATDPSGQVEYVFDPNSGVFALGAPKPHVKFPSGSPHQQLAQAIGADPDTVVGGIAHGSGNGVLLLDSQSGHYWMNWTEEVGTQLVEMLRTHGIEATR